MATQHDLFTLPQNILTSESTIRDLLASIVHTDTTLAEKIAAIDRNGLWPFLNGSWLRPEIRFLLEVADGLESLRLYKINRTLSEADLNGQLDLHPEDASLLADIPQPHLLFSSQAIFAHTATAYREMVMQLYMWGKRITRYRGVCTTWDQAVDKQVWCTNIDTVYFLQQLSDAGVLARQDVCTAMEVGVGGGAIAKTLAVYLAGLHELTVTDISPYALVCAKRNILPVLQDGQRLHLYLGKGIRSIAAQVDLLVVNPPYIPHMQRPDATDPYRGTGLIQEIVDIGVDYLSPANPQAAIYMGMSSLAERDLQIYLAQTERVAVERLGTPKEVPLKILAVNENQEWLAFLEREHGLVRSPKRLKEEGYEFWHTLSVLKLTRCLS